MTAPLLPWPSIKDYTFTTVWTDGSGAVNDEGPHVDDGLYYTAMYHAAMQRLRVALEALDTIRQSQNELAMTRYAKDALAAIGSLPTLPPLPDLPPHPGEGE